MFLRPPLVSAGKAPRPTARPPAGAGPPALVGRLQAVTGLAKILILHDWTACTHSIRTLHSVQVRGLWRGPAPRNRDGSHGLGKNRKPRH